MSKNLSAKYYQENKERLQKKARERYQNLSKEEKEKKLQYGSYLVTYAFQSESTLCSCLMVKELLAQNRREI